MVEDKRRQARIFAMQFLYQCECERVYHFHSARFDSFAEHFGLTEWIKIKSKDLSRGVLDNLGHWDELLASYSEHWSLSRMSITDRSLLRLGSLELERSSAPIKVILNEYIELAREYGSENSAAFVNGLLDKIARKAPQMKNRSNIQASPESMC